MVIFTEWDPGKEEEGRIVGCGKEDEGRERKEKEEAEQNTVHGAFNRCNGDSFSFLPIVAMYA